MLSAFASHSVVPVHVSIYLRESHVDKIEPALQSFGDHHPSSTRWAHGRQQMHALRGKDKSICVLYLFDSGAPSSAKLCDVDHCMDLRDLSLLLLYILKRNCYFTAHVFAGLVRSELSAKVSPVAFYQRVKGFDSQVNADSVCWLCSLIRIQHLPKIQPWN